jgi:integrase
MRGSTFKRCGCRDEAGKLLGTRCPMLRGSKHGTWYYSIDLPHGDGSRRRLKRGGFPTQRSAQEALQRVSSRLAVGQQSNDRETTGEYLRTWIAQQRQLRATTRRSYESHLRLYLVPQLGDIPLERLRPADIAAMYHSIEAANATKGRPTGPATIRRVHATLRSALNDAVKQQRLAYNPALHVKLPDATPPKVDPWQPAELGAFLDAAMGDRLGALYELMAMTGLRRGEACGLRWRDVDLRLGVITVVQQVIEYGQRLEIGPPKTRGGEHRKVDIDGRTIASLESHRASQTVERHEWGDAWIDTGLVFTREDGTPLRPEYVTRNMQRIAERAGLSRKRLHDLRHGAASLQLAAGVPLAIISKRLGHSSINITADTYSHLLEGAGREAAERTAALVPRADNRPGPTSVPQDPLRASATR